jgi:hypothetical protein
MAEDEWNVGGSLSDLTATEFLVFNSDAVKADLQGRLSSSRDQPLAFDPSRNTASAQFSLVPRDKNLPVSSFEIRGGEAGPSSTDLSVSTKLLRYSNRTVYLPKGAGGRQVTDTVSGKAGPFSAFYSETGQPGNQGLEQTSYGGRMNIGPAELFARRTRSRQDVVDPLLLNTGQDTEIDTIGARGSLPLGPGTLSGDVSRQYREERGPQQIGQESRPMAQAPNETNYRLGLEGPVGPGRFGLHGGARHVRGVGVEPSAEAKYTYENPLGLGGRFSATGSYVNPLDPSRRSAVEAMLRYKLRF